MTIDLEGDLRREFDAATPPSSLTFHPESVVRQGNRSIRRRRFVASGSAAMAVALVATGATLLTRPHDSAAPQPATPAPTRTATSGTSGIVHAETPAMQWGGSAQVEFNRDPSVKLNVKYSMVTDKGRRYEVGGSSAGKPGQKPDVTWRSAVVEGHPVTIGLVPGNPTNLSIDGGGNEGSTHEVVKGTGYTMFYVTYPTVRAAGKKSARPTEFASIRWAGPDGVVDGIAGKHRLSGRTLAIDTGVSVEVVLRPGDGTLTTVSGEARLRDAAGGYAMPLTVADTDAQGAAVMTGRYPTSRRITDKDGRQSRYVNNDGAPVAAGILPPGASNIGVILTTNDIANGLPVTESLPDGRVIFAVKAEGARPSQASKDSIKAVTWTNADGSKGRKDVTQQKR